MSRLFCICFFGTKIYPIFARMNKNENIMNLSLIHISEPTRQAEISYAVFCLKKKKKKQQTEKFPIKR